MAILIELRNTLGFKERYNMVYWMTARKNVEKAYCCSLAHPLHFKVLSRNIKLTTDRLITSWIVNLLESCRSHILPRDFLPFIETEGALTCSHEPLLYEQKNTWTQLSHDVELGLSLCGKSIDWEYLKNWCRKYFDQTRGKVSMLRKILHS
jgi:hypothetical protein